MKTKEIKGQVKTAILKRCRRVKRIPGKLCCLPIILLLMALSIVSLVPNPVFAQPSLLTTMLPSAQQVFYISVASPPLIFSTTYLPSGKENAAYHATMSVSGGTLPYNWYVVSGSLPAGLTVDATTGTIYGIPARGTVGTSIFTINLTDSSATPVSTQRSFAITVEKGSYQTTITIGSGLKAGETALFINGVQVSSLQGGRSIERNFDLDTNQTVSVEPAVQDPSEQGTRYKVENERIMVTEYAPDAQFNYYAEYYVQINSRPSDVGQITGSGWYMEGNILRSAAPGTVQREADPDTQYRFSYWTLPTGGRVDGGNLNQSIDAPGVYTANYDTYYRLVFTSAFGEQKESAWYKSGTRAEWSLATDQVPMSGILGFFKGTINAVNSRGAVVMDKPQNVSITWEPDYTMPLILITVALLLAIICIYGLSIILRGPVNNPAPVYATAQTPPPPLQSVIPQYYTVPAPTYFIPPPVSFISPPAQPLNPAVIIPVLRTESFLTRISEPLRQEEPGSGRQKIMEEFGKLLDNYAREVVASRQNPPPGLAKADEVTQITLAGPHKLK